MTRIDGRTNKDLRDIKITRGWLDHAEGSVLVEFGKTRVLCVASFTPGVPRWLKDSGNVVKQYPIAIGAPESPTIPGIYSILKKVKDPTYYSKSHHKIFPAGPNDPVGVRFMPYLKSATDGKVYAVHGTAWPRWVHLRAAASLGCIRMLNSDVIEVFNQVEVGTPVVIR